MKARQKRKRFLALNLLGTSAESKISDLTTSIRNHVEVKKHQRNNCIESTSDLKSTLFM